MKIQPYIEKLESSEEYQEFKGKYENAFLIAGFFILDFESGQNLHQIDYYVPSEKKVAAFTLDEKVLVQMLKLIDDNVPEKLDIRTNIDLDALKGIIEDEMKNRGMSESIRKMIAVIQKVEGKDIWNVNCVLSGMEILKAHIDDESETVLKMERSSILDYIKKVPLPVNQGNKNPVSEKDIELEIEKLDKIKDALKKEKVGIEKNKKQE